MSAYKLQTQSMQHQLAGVTRALTQPIAFAYLAETGTGKTHMVLAEFQQRLNDDDITDLLVIAPAGSIRNWYEDKSEDEVSELKKHLDPNLLQKLLVVANRKKVFWKIRQKKMLTTKDPRALFVNIEALSMGNATKPSNAEVLCRQLLTAGRCMMVVDESTTIRSKSSRTKAILRLGQLAASRRILTGLVTPKSPLDLYYQMNFLDPQILNQPSFVNFRAKYAKVKHVCREPLPIVDMRLRQAMRKKFYSLDISRLTYNEKVNWIFKLGGWIQSFPMILNYQHIDELHERIKPYCYQVLKKDCLELQDKTYQFRYVELNAVQNKAYREILSDATSQLSNGRHVTVKSVIDQLIRLHQVTCGHVRDEEGRMHDLGTNRVSSLINILDEHDGKAIIWVTYDFELRRIAAELIQEYGKEAVAMFWGGNASTRHTDESRFLSDPECRFMVSTPMSGGRGNTWNVATLAVYAANNHNLEHRYQSEDRCHRIGQANKVTYIDLMVRDTVEEKIIQSLRRKIDLSTMITGENYREWLI